MMTMDYVKTCARVVYSRMRPKTGMQQLTEYLTRFPETTEEQRITLINSWPAWNGTLCARVVQLNRTPLSESEDLGLNPSMSSKFCDCSWLDDIPNFCSFCMKPTKDYWLVGRFLNMVPSSNG